MRLYELLKSGDVINTHFNAHYVVRGHGRVYNRVTGCTTDTDNFNYPEIPSYITSVVRGTENITESLRSQLADANPPQLKYGDRVVHKASPEEIGVVIEKKDDYTYVVAFNGSSSHGPFVETHPVQKLEKR